MSTSLIISESTSRFVDVVPSGEQVTISQFRERTFENLDSVYLIGTIENELLAEIPQLLKAGGKIHLITTVSEDDESSVQNQFMMAFMMNGFVESSSAPVLDEVLVSLVKKDSEVDNCKCVQFSASKPDFNVGASVALKLPKKNSVVKSSLQKWTVLADDDFGDEEDDAIDEDTLLDDDIGVNSAPRDDCEVGKGGKKRACKDCTCGRKDMDDNPVVSKKELKEMVSSCGSCFKGDAFRCGSCPYLGQPAFKPGMGKIVLNLDGDDI